MTQDIRGTILLAKPPRGRPESAVKGHVFRSIAEVEKGSDLNERAFLECDETKGEVRLLGRRQMVLSMDTLCHHLDTLVGSQVAGVIIKNLEFREGKEEAERFLRDHPDASIDEFLDFMKRLDSLSGVGITSVTLPKDPNAPILIAISNPYIKSTNGSSSALLFSWWCGALSLALHRELDLESVDYDLAKDVLNCRIRPRGGET